MTNDRRQKRGTQPRRDLYQQVTDQVIATLESGNIPWYPDKMWNAAGCNAAPYNAVSGHRYRGWNQMALAAVAANLSGERYDPRFCTFNQAKEQGWHVKKGAKSSLVVLFKQISVHRGGRATEESPSGRRRESLLDLAARHRQGEKPAPRDESGDKEPDQDVRRVWVLRGYNVFHASMIEGMPAIKDQPVPWSSSKAVQSMLAELKAQGLTFQEGGEKASYNPSLDRLRMPLKSAFESSMNYDHVLAHELGHSTGATTRLNRPDLQKYGEDLQARAREELVAEMASAMLCSQLGITYDVSRHADYVQNWLDAIRADKKLVIRAGGMASRACDYLLDLVPDLQAEMLAYRKAESGLHEIVEEVTDLSAIGDDLDLAGMEVMDWVEEEARAFGGMEVDSIDVEDFLDIPAPKARKTSVIGGPSV